MKEFNWYLTTKHNYILNRGFAVNDKWKPEGRQWHAEQRKWNREEGNLSFIVTASLQWQTATCKHCEIQYMMW